jgi:hypothetical protein
LTAEISSIYSKKDRDSRTWSLRYVTGTLIGTIGERVIGASTVDSPAVILTRIVFD